MSVKSKVDGDEHPEVRNDQPSSRSPLSDPSDSAPWTKDEKRPLPPIPDPATLDLYSL